MVVTCHQPNYLPGVSVLRKVAASDAVIWLDRVRFSKGGWINRNELPGGPMLTVPCNRETWKGEIRDVEIADFNGWNRKHARTLRQRYRSEDHFEKGAGLVSTLDNAWRIGTRLVDLNWICIQHLLAGFEVDTVQHWQHDLMGDGETISHKIADMCGLLGASTYLSGPSGHRYLDLEPFRERRITVKYFDHRGPNPSAVDSLFVHGRL